MDDAMGEGEELSQSDFLGSNFEDEQQFIEQEAEGYGHHGGHNPGQGYYDG